MRDIVRNGHVAGFAGVMAIIIAVSAAAIAGEYEAKRLDRINQESLHHVGR